MFDTYGHCPFGLTCRFATGHIRFNAETNTYEILKDEEKVKAHSGVCQIYNVLDGDLKNKLWKRKYNFSRTEKINKTVADYMKSNDSVVDLKYNRYKGSVSIKQEQTVVTENAKEEEEDKKPSTEKKVGLVTDEDLIKLRPGEKKKIQWQNKLYLAPLTTVNRIEKWKTKNKCL